jgi:putative tricarboxylic transport membrane protein
MPVLILGISMFVFAAVSLWDAARITKNYRVPGAFDMVGPDRYLAGIAILIGILGAALIVRSLGEVRKVRQATSESSFLDSYRHFVLLGILLAYALLMPVFGYVLTTLVFFVATFWTMGQTDWRWTVPSSIGATAVFYFAFVRLADMALPAGIWGVG